VIEEVARLVWVAGRRPIRNERDVVATPRQSGQSGGVSCTVGGGNGGEGRPTWRQLLPGLDPVPRLGRGYAGSPHGAACHDQECDDQGRALGPETSCGSHFHVLLQEEAGVCGPFNNAVSHGVNVGGGFGVGRGFGGIGTVGGGPGTKKLGSGSDVGVATGAVGSAGAVATGNGGGVGGGTGVRTGWAMGGGRGAGTGAPFAGPGTTRPGPPPPAVMPLPPVDGGRGAPPASTGGPALGMAGFRGAGGAAVFLDGTGVLPPVGRSGTGCGAGVATAGAVGARPLLGTGIGAGVGTVWATWDGRGAG